jgi:hypothetical protein
MRLAMELQVSCMQYHYINPLCIPLISSVQVEQHEVTSGTLEEQMGIVLFVLKVTHSCKEPPISMLATNLESESYGDCFLQSSFTCSSLWPTWMILSEFAPIFQGRFLGAFTVRPCSPPARAVRPWKGRPAPAEQGPAGHASRGARPIPESCMRSFPSAALRTKGVAIGRTGPQGPTRTQELRRQRC